MNYLSDRRFFYLATLVVIIVAVFYFLSNYEVKRKVHIGHHGKKVTTEIKEKE